MSWSSPNLTLKWGPYTKPDPEEQLKVVEVVQKSLGGAGGTPVILLHQAVEKLRQGGVFDIDNVPKLVEELEKKAEEKKAEDAELMKEQAKAVPVQPGKPPMAGKPVAKKPGGFPK